MQCPYCHSNVDEGVKICPVCHGDIEASMRRAQETITTTWQRPAPAPSVGEPTQRMPREQQAPQGGYGQAYQQPQQQAPYGAQPQHAYGQPQHYQQPAPGPQRAQQQPPAHGASPMNSSMPPRQQQGYRPFDTKSMNAAPKWPIVLIVILVVIIAVAVILLITKPWASSTTITPTQTQPTPVAAQSTSADAASQQQAATAQQSATTDAAGTPAPAAAPATTSEADVYAALSEAYDQLSGFDSRISDVAVQFNSADVLHADLATRQTALTNATQLQTEINNEAAAVAAVTATGTTYEATQTEIANLYNDLSNRIRVLVEALTLSVNAGDNPASVDGQVGDVLSADNGPDGVNTYKADYEANYAAAQPAAPAA